MKISRILALGALAALLTFSCSDDDTGNNTPVD